MRYSLGSDEKTKQIRDLKDIVKKLEKQNKNPHRPLKVGYLDNLIEGFRKELEKIAKSLW
jgi:hypothetical protein